MSATQRTLATIVEQLTQINTRLDLLDTVNTHLDTGLTQINARFDEQLTTMNTRFNVQAILHSAQTLEIAERFERINRQTKDDMRATTGILEKNLYRRHYNSYITSPTAQILMPLRANGEEVDLREGYWGFSGPGVTRQSIENATDDQINELLQRLEVNGTWLANRRIFLWSVLGLSSPPATLLP